MWEIMMDCQHARLLLEFARPGQHELDTTETEALETHLEDCAECGRIAQAERRVDHVVRQALLNVPVPAGLRDRLMERLVAERDAWYRRWLVRGVGLAAAIVLVVWLGQAWWSSRVPAVDWVALQNDLEPRDAAQIEAWFRLRHQGIVTHPDLNYKLVAGYGVSLLQGQHVPHLVFFAPAQGADKPAAIAHVYVLSDRQFDLETTKSTMGQHYFHQTVLVEKPPEHPDFLFLIITSSKTLEPFKKSLRL
jgi:hypothetical protein